MKIKRFVIYNRDTKTFIDKHGKWCDSFSSARLFTANKVNAYLQFMHKQPKRYPIVNWGSIKVVPVKLKIRKEDLL